MAVEGGVDFEGVTGRVSVGSLVWFSLLIYSWHMCISLSITLARFMCLWDVLVIVAWSATAG
jgi:hypothetical protein